MFLFNTCVLSIKLVFEKQEVPYSNYNYKYFGKGKRGKEKLAK